MRCLYMVLKERGYRQVSLPIPLVERIEKYVKEHQEEGFTSIPEFIRQAIREKIERSEKFTSIPEFIREALRGDGIARP